MSHWDFRRIATKANTYFCAILYEALPPCLPMCTRASCFLFSQAPFSTGERRRRSKTDRRALETANLVRDTVAATVLTELLPRWGT